MTPFNEIYSVYKSSNNDGSITNCCPVKYYWDDTANGCLPITISGCEESLDNSDCTKCESNKRLYDGVCCNYN
ncbi:MAG: hypothetical protein DHS20C13_26070 [Thermodesulfobacteriota bacterium]|nr:MAG: hypothetical protein DHS20C13_26070 [Thermodesulfobacteriota bacterium]